MERKTLVGLLITATALFAVSVWYIGYVTKWTWKRSA